MLPVEDQRLGRVFGGDETGELSDEVLGPGGDGVEVALERGGQIRLLERIVAGDPPGETLGQPPVDRVGNGSRRAQVVFLPTRTPYFSMSTLTT